MVLIQQSTIQSSRERCREGSDRDRREWLVVSRRVVVAVVVERGIMRILVHISRRISRVVTTCLVPRRLPAPSCTPLVHVAHLSIVINHFIDIRTAMITGGRCLPSTRRLSGAGKGTWMEDTARRGGPSVRLRACACVSRWLMTARYPIHSRLRERNERWPVGLSIAA